MRDTIGKGPRRGQAIDFVHVYFSFKILGSNFEGSRRSVIAHRPPRIHRVSRPTSTNTVQVSWMTVARFTITTNDEM